MCRVESESDDYNEDDDDEEVGEDVQCVSVFLSPHIQFKFSSIVSSCSSSSSSTFSALACFKPRVSDKNKTRLRDHNLSHCTQHTHSPSLHPSIHPVRVCHKLAVIGKHSIFFSRLDNDDDDDDDDKIYIKRIECSRDTGSATRSSRSSSK